MRHGLFITFEGGEGTGKSTQAQFLQEYLIAQGHEVLLTREPGGSPGAEEIRHLLVRRADNYWSPQSEVLLLYAARIDHWLKVISPALMMGTHVICDRFADSTTAYQGYGRGVDLNFLASLYKDTLGMIHPTRTYIFDLDPALGLARAHKRSELSSYDDRFERMDLEFHHRVREGFLTIAKNCFQRCKIISANQAKESIQNLVRKDVNLLLTRADN